MLIKLSEADKTYDQNEISLIKRVGLQMGLTVEEIKEIKHHPETIQEELPNSIKDRFLFFYHMIHLIRVDGKISTIEKETLRKLGFKYYLNAGLVDDIFNLIELHPNELIPDKDLMVHANKYLN